MKITTLIKHSGIALAILGALSACSSSGGGGDDGGTTTQKTGSVLANGYLQFATVCLDTTKNNSCADEDNSVKTESDNNGSFTMSALVEQFSQFAIIAESKDDGSTTDEGGAIAAGEKLVLSTPPGKTEPSTGNITVSPLTTLVQGYRDANVGLTTEAAEADIKENLGVEASSTVSLFDDYIAQLQALASSGNSKPIATGVLTNTEAYTLFNQVAQVTTETIQQAIDDADGVPGVDLNDQLDSLITIVIDDVVESLPNLVVAIGELDSTAAAEFNAATVAALVTSVGLEIDVNTLADTLAEQEQINAATATGMQAIINEGLNFFDFDFDFFSEVFIISRDEITISTSNASLLSAVTTELDPNNLAAGFTTPLGNGSNSGFYLDATNGWTPEPQSEADGAPVIFNADGSADITFTTGRSYRVSGAVSDIAGDFIRDYSPNDPFSQSTIPSTSTLVFSSGAKAIRFSGVSLNDEYRLETDFPAQSLSGGNATQLSDILGSAIDANNNFLGDQIAFDNNSSNFRRIGIEFIGDDLSGALDTSGTTNFYLIEDTFDASGAFIGTTITPLPDTSTWTIATISGETLLTSAFPLGIKNLMQSFDDGSNSSGILYSVASVNNNADLYRGYFSLEGEAFADESWAFNSIAADDIENFIISELTGGSATALPPIPDTTSFADGDTFTIDLFQYDVVNDLILDNGSPSFTRGPDFNALAAGSVVDLSLNIFASPGVLETPIEFDRITVDSTDPTIITSATFDNATGQATGATDTGTISLVNGELVVTLVNDQDGETINSLMIPIQATTDPITGGSINVLVIFTVSAADGSNLFSGVVTGLLSPLGQG